MRWRERLLAGAGMPGSLYWTLLALILAGSVWEAILGRWGRALEGLLAAGTVLILIRVLSRAQGWRFWPW